MTGESVFQRLKSLIARGELTAATDGLKDLLTGFRAAGRFVGSSHENELLSQSARMARLKQASRSNVVSPIEFEREMSAINLAILELIDEVERSATVPLPVKEKPIELLPATSTALEKIIGATSQLKSLSWLHKGLLCAKSVCRVVGPAGVGSGFVVGKGVLLTNNHVLGTPVDASRSSVEFNFEEDEAGNIRRVVKYLLDPSEFLTSHLLDCTAVKIRQDQNPVDLAHWGGLEIACGVEASLEDHVTIIQHPRGGVKQICLTDNRIVNIFDGKMQYTTDTMPGSSGSPVFSDNWRVIAIHHAGGDLIKNAQGDRHFVNQGILFKSILADREFQRFLSLPAP